MPRMHIFALLSILAMLLAACAPTGSSQVEDIRAGQLPTDTAGAAATSEQNFVTPVPKSPEDATPTNRSDLPKEPPKTCPVTQPADPPFMPSAPYPASAPNAGQFWYGEEDLWTMLPVDGTWPQLAHSEKVFWWREGYDGSEEPEPDLAMSARLLGDHRDVWRARAELRSVGGAVGWKNGRVEAIHSRVGGRRIENHQFY